MESSCLVIAIRILDSDIDFYLVEDLQSLPYCIKGSPLKNKFDKLHNVTVIL